MQKIVKALATGDRAGTPMISATTFKSVLLDILTAFLALGLLIATLVARPVNDLLPFLVATVIAYFAVGLFRGNSGPTNLLFKALLIDSGGSVPVVAMKLTGMAFTANGYTSLFVLVSLLATVCGVATRRLWARGRRTQGAMLASAFLVTIMPALLTSVPPLIARLSSQSVDRPAPAFSITDLNGRVVNSSELKGHVVVLAFWATWCEPCMNELPALQKIRAAYQADPRVVFWAINTGRGGDTAEKAANFVRQTRLKLRCAFDNREVARGLGVESLPTLIVLDKSGHVRLVHNGYDASEHLASNLSREIESLLREPS